MFEENTSKKVKQNIPPQDYVYMGHLTSTRTGKTEETYIPAEHGYQFCTDGIYSFYTKLNI